MDIVTVIKCIGLAILIALIYNMYHNRGGGCTWAQ